MKREEIYFENVRKVENVLNLSRIISELNSLESIFLKFYLNDEIKQDFN